MELHCLVTKRRRDRCAGPATRRPAGRGLCTLTWPVFQAVKSAGRQRRPRIQTVTAVILSSLFSVVICCTRNCLVGVDDVHKSAGPVVLHGGGGNQCRLSAFAASSRAFTNWFGKQRQVLVGETPPGTSRFPSWCRPGCPARSAFRSRSASRRSGRRRPPEACGCPSCACTCGRSSSETLKTTVIGCNCVITTSVELLPEKTVFPGSTRRSPTRPLMGATMWQ